MKKWVGQSIWLSLVIVLATVFLARSFDYVLALAVGGLVILSLKKYSKSEGLKINIYSSGVVLIVLVIVSFIIRNVFYGIVDEGNSFLLSMFLGITNLDNILLRGLISLIVFNVPYLIYYFFGKNLTDNNLS